MSMAQNISKVCFVTLFLKTTLDHSQILAICSQINQSMVGVCGHKLAGVHILSSCFKDLVPGPSLKDWWNFPRWPRKPKLFLEQIRIRTPTTNQPLWYQLTLLVPKMKMYFLLKMEIFQPAMLVLPKGICPLHSPLQFFPACQGSFELGLYRAVEGISDKYGKVENSLDGLDFSETTNTQEKK